MFSARRRRPPDPWHRAYQLARGRDAQSSERNPAVPGPRCHRPDSDPGPPAPVSSACQASEPARAQCHRPDSDLP
eukprot:38009-Hanusia_phi.AAC.1